MILGVARRNVSGNAAETRCTHHWSGGGGEHRVTPHLKGHCHGDFTVFRSVLCENHYVLPLLIQNAPEELEEDTE